MKTIPETPSAPSFDEKLAKPVPPTRHEPTGRTFCFVQGDHLFSATGLYIATEERETPSQERKNARPPSS